MLAAIVVGALTAWYLGIQAGVIAAIVTVVALIASAFVPGLTIAVYALVLAWCAALYFLGAKMSAKKPGPGIPTSMLGGVANQVSGWLKKLRDKA